MHLKVSTLVLLMLVVTVFALEEEERLAPSDEQGRDCNFRWNSRCKPMPSRCAQPNNDCNSSTLPCCNAHKYKCDCNWLWKDCKCVEK
uniref:U27-Liphistoxin-Lm1a_1 n=1 Tax=Liphistius malayanus TaxID=1203467 RepID=A0A482ZI10_9ARAC